MAHVEKAINKSTKVDGMLDKMVASKLIMALLLCETFIFKKHVTEASVLFDKLQIPQVPRYPYFKWCEYDSPVPRLYLHMCKFYLEHLWPLELPLFHWHQLNSVGLDP